MDMLKKIFATIILIALFGLRLSAQDAGKALKFDGIDDFVSVPLNDHDLSNFTLECWVNAPTYATSVHYLSLQQSAYLILGDYGINAISTWADGLTPIDAGSAGVSGQPTISVDVWHHFAFTFDGSSQKVLIDGVVVVDAATTGTVTLDNAIYNVGLTIGARYSQTTQFTEGLIDEVRIWNIARTPADINARKNVILQGIEKGLVGYWRFDDDVVDSSPYGQDGTVSGGATFADSSAPVSNPVFNKVTQGEIVTDNFNNYQACWGDYNNDGHPDLFVPSTNGANALYKNNGDGTFTPVVAGDLGADSSTSYGASWGDYDNDGDLDLFVANSGDNALYTNNGDETFTLTVAGDLGADGIASYNGAWADYDNDGFLDLAVANSSGNPNYLYYNNGNGTFTLDADTFLADTGSSWSLAWGDYDGNGYVDLYIANSGVANYLYKNNGGTFTKVTTGDPVLDVATNYSASWVDYDNDGDLDLFAPSSGGNNLLYNNDGKGNFTKITTGVVVTSQGENWSGTWGDYNNDGWQDLLIAKNGKNYLLKNTGSGNFVQDESTIITDATGYSLGGAWEDYDGDGDLDLFVANFTGVNELYVNNGNDANWIGINLHGVASNVDGIGSKVWIEDSYGYLHLFEKNTINGRGQSASIHVGLGSASIKNIYVQWPSGLFQSAKPSNNQQITIEEFTTTSGRPNILLVTAENANYVADVQKKLIKSGHFELIQNFSTQDGTGVTPSVETLSSYDAVMTWSNFRYDDPVLLGDNLADYIDQGGSVVKGVFATYTDFDIKGRLASDYTLLTTASYVSTAGILGTVLAPDHPIMNGVLSFDGGTTAYRTNGSVADGDVIAQWDDGLPLIVAKEYSNGGKRVDLNFRPPSADAFAGSWLPSSDGAKIMTNALLWAIAPPDQFTKVINSDVNTPGTSTWGVAWGDIENDNHPDLFVGNQGAPFLYMNNGDGTLTANTTDAVVLDASVYVPSSSWGDYDNDGFQDLFVADYNGNSKLYRNNGDGALSLANEFMEGTSTTGSAWGDYDSDGYLDLFMATYGGPNYLYHNNADGTFSLITEGEIVTESYDSYGCVWGDYNDDGNPDIFVANAFAPSSLFKNNGDGTFERVTGIIEGENSEYSVTASWGDFDNDSDLDLFVGNYSAQNNNLYLNNGDGTFEAVLNQGIVTSNGSALSSSWQDYNNDGFLDLFVANGNGNDELYQNNGDGTFTTIYSWAPVINETASYGMGWADYNNDGYEDLFVANFSGGDNYLFQNNAIAGNNWINILLKGVESNALAVGAKVYVTVNDETQMREVTTQGGFSTQSSINVEFGLAVATVIDEILINWPSGIDQYLYNVDANQFITIKEDVVPPLVDAENFPALYDMNGGTQEASITVSDDQGVAYVEVGYVGISERVEDKKFVEASTSDGVTYTFDLAAIKNQSEALGLAYVFQVTDLAGNTAESNIGVTHVAFFGENTPTIPNLKFGSGETDYQIISVPLELNNASLSDVFVDDLGAIDNTKWRIYQYQNGNTNELNGSSRINVGKGFWLIARDNATVDIGEGNVPQVTKADPFQLSLSSGWNQIGNPYNFTISWQDVLDYNGNPSDVDSELTVYNGGYSASDQLGRYKGAFVFSSSAITLAIPVVKNNSLSGGRKEAKEQNPIDGKNWSVDLELESNGVTNSLGGIGMDQQASNTEKDKFDRLTVPRFIKYLEMNMDDQGYQGNAFTRSVVPTVDHNVWKFTVASNMDQQKVTINWDNTYWGDSEKQLVLFDKVSQKSINMRETMSYSFNYYGDRQFEILYGNPDFIKEKLTPKTIEIGKAHPNPFTDQSTILFTIPADEVYNIKLTIYNQLGAVVKVISQDGLGAGYHQIDWDGTNYQGVKASSGIYLGQIDVINAHNSTRYSQRLILK